MRESKLAELMRILTAEDLRQIKKMLVSPFYTSNPNLLTLFSALRSTHPELNSKKIEKRILFKKLFPKHHYSDIKLRNLSSDLVHVIEQYFLHQDLMSRDFDRRIRFIRILKSKGLMSLYEKELKRLKQELNNQPYRDHHFFNELLELTLIEIEDDKGDRLEKRYALLEDWDYFLEHFYQFSNARLSLAKSNLRQIIKSDETYQPVDRKPEALLHFYQNIINLLETQDLALFEKLKRFFSEHLDLIRPSLRAEFLSLLSNFAIKQMAVDDEKYNKEVLDLYKLGLQHDILFSSGRITDVAYFNIVVCGSKAKDFDWVETFINEYEPKLSGSGKGDIKVLSLATFYFHQESYAEALDQLNIHVFRHPQLKDIAKTLSIRCYYEMYLLNPSYYEMLIAAIDSDMRNSRRLEYLTVDKLTTRINFLSFLKKLANVRMVGKLNEEQKTIMLKNLGKDEITLSRSWLLSVIER